jgi:DNA-binding NtrC family response regulator
MIRRHEELTSGLIKMSKKNLLVVDDDASIRESLKKVLVQSGYDVVLGADGQEAQEILQQHRFDLLILDLDMPRRDGWDVIEDARAFAPAMPVVIVTGFSSQLASYHFQGVAGLMRKPVDAQVLLDEIERLLAQSPDERSHGKGAASSAPCNLESTPAR